jgi:hypothetical protein
MDRLETQLARLVEQRVLSALQAQELADAARADRQDGQSVPESGYPSRFKDRPPRALRCWRFLVTSEVPSC